MKADNQKTKLYTGLGVMVLASIAVVACTEPAYNALNKAGRVEKTEHIYTPGTYEGEAQGFGGAVKASVTVDEVYITELKLTGEGKPRISAALPLRHWKPKFISSRPQKWTAYPVQRSPAMR